MYRRWYLSKRKLHPTSSRCQHANISTGPMPKRLCRQGDQVLDRSPSPPRHWPLRRHRRPHPSPHPLLLLVILSSPLQTAQIRQKVRGSWPSPTPTTSLKRPPPRPAESQQLWQRPHAANGTEPHSRPMGPESESWTAHAKSTAALYAEFDAVCVIMLQLRIDCFLLLYIS